MSHLSVDKEICKRDGICVEICPAQIIELVDDGFPISISENEEFCINCGQCISVCPHGALTLRETRPDECKTIQKELVLTAELARQWVMARRSVRTFKDKKVGTDLLNELIHVSRYAPTGGNTQPVQWMVFEDPSDVKEIAGMVADWMQTMIDGAGDPFYPVDRMERLVDAWKNGQDRICRGAPHLIVAYGPLEIPASQSSCLIALTTLELLAPAYGLGACWAGYFMGASMSYLPLIEFLNLPKGHQCFGGMMIGYSKYNYQRIPLRNEPVISWR